MLRALLPILALFAACMADGGAAEENGAKIGGATTVQAVEIAGDIGRTELRIGFDAAPEVALFALSAPDRIVLDLGETAWRFAPPPAQGLVAGLRYGLAAPGRGRMVFDLAEPAIIAERRLDQGARLHWLTLTLAPQGRAAFDAAAGWPQGAGPQQAGAAPARPVLIALDPGHGGVDGGAVRAGVVEKWVVLDFALRLETRLRDAGFDVMLTRRTDVFVPLATRVERARRARADLFLSIHADTVEQGEASGASVYTLAATPSDDLAEGLALRENAADRLGGGPIAAAGADVARALIALVRRDTLARSERFAEALIAALGVRIPLLESRPHRRAGFRVLKGPDMPSALLEIGFLSNAADRARLGDPKWRRGALDGVAEAALAWAEEIAREREATD